MGKIYVCDICKEQFAESYKIKKMKLYGHQDLELCTICANELVQHINARIKLYSKEENKDTFNKKTYLSDMVDIEKLLVTIWPENLNQRTRLRNALENKSLEAVIYSSVPPYCIGQKTWERVKDYILRVKEVQEYIKKKKENKNGND